jgi:hypothetical protein
MRARAAGYHSDPGVEGFRTDLVQGVLVSLTEGSS